MLEVYEPLRVESTPLCRSGFYIVDTILGKGVFKFTPHLASPHEHPLSDCEELFISLPFIGTQARSFEGLMVRGGLGRTSSSHTKISVEASKYWVIND
jgi:hypothetical protein